MHKIFLTIAIFSIAINGAAQNSKISGLVLDQPSGQPLIGANLELVLSGVGCSTDQDGNFVLENFFLLTDTLVISYIGYKTEKKTVELMTGSDLYLTIYLEPVILEGQRIIISARGEPDRAVHRESPVAFSRLDSDQIRSAYTTSDLPQLIREVPGVWNSSAGLGESELKIRGFSSEDIRVMINDIPINNPEDNSLIWSDWSGLSQMAHSLEVQRGAGFSASGRNAFGGTVNISTIGLNSKRNTEFRFSSGYFQRSGIESGQNTGKYYDAETGELRTIENPFNYAYSARFDSGPIYNDLLNLCLFFERKAGDSYLLGTDYDGYSIGIEAAMRLEKHGIYGLFFISPQQHHQAFALQDIDLLQTLGREYNRKNHTWQESFYTNPFFSLKHEWYLAEHSTLVNNIFLNIGRGADQSLVNDLFDVESGKIGFQPATKFNDAYAFGRHARYLYEQFGLMTTNFIPTDCTGVGLYQFNGYAFEQDVEPANFFADQHSHSYQRRDRRDHWQAGIISTLSHSFNRDMEIELGIDFRYWNGNRKSEMLMLKISDFDSYRPPNSTIQDDIFLDRTQSIYDFDTRILNLAFFARYHWIITKSWNVMCGTPVSFSRYVVDENPVQLMDFGTMNFFDVSKRTTADLMSYRNTYSLTNDYQRQYLYWSPWIGTNYNLNPAANIFFRYATARKEPSVLDWYDYHKGPLFDKKYYPELDDAVQLEPETTNGVELGINYKSPLGGIELNYYYTHLQDKIESVTDIDGRRQTINAGEASFQGIEGSVLFNWKKFFLKGSFALSRNRWLNMNVREIFGNPAEDVENKVVPFAPEKAASVKIGYPFLDKINVKFRIEFWDDYYGTYTNTYLKTVEKVVDGLHFKEIEKHQAKLPYYLDIGLQLSYKISTKSSLLNFRLDLNNLLNRSDNFMGAQYSVDYTRNDFQGGRYNWYVLPAPLFNVFFTVEVSLNES